MSKKEVRKVIGEFERSGKELQSEQATRWLARNLSKIQTEMRSEHFNRGKPSVNRPGNIKEGTMLFFGYEPKTKDELPFWDSFPLVILLHKKGNSILGLNLHYLSPTLRANFLNNLLKLVDNPDYVYDPPAYFKVTYPFLKATAKLKPYKAAIKRYYLNCINTKVNVIPSDEWQYTTFMPLDKFKGATREQVWKWANRYSK
jgi:hypothetical protein